MWLWLPADIIHVILSEWLQTKELGLLDVAHTCKRRELLWSCFRRLLDIQCSTARMYNWSFDRQIPVKHLNLYDNMFKCDCTFAHSKFKCRVNFSYVQEIMVCDFGRRVQEPKLIIINQCKNLKGLTATNIGIFRSMNSNILRNLHSIMFEGYDEYHNIAPLLRKAGCYQLRHIGFKFIYTQRHKASYYDDCSALVQQNPLLEKVYIPCDVGLLKAIAEYCPNIKRLELKLFSGENLFLEVGNFLNKYANSLQDVNIGHEGSSVTYVHNNKAKTLRIKEGMSSGEIDIICNSLRELSSILFLKCDFQSKSILQTLHHSRNTLTELELLNVINIESNDILWLLSTCPLLTNLSLYGSHWNDEAVEQLFVHSNVNHKLRELTIGGELQFETCFQVLLKCPSVSDFIFSGMISIQTELQEWLCKLQDNYAQKGVNWNTRILTDQWYYPEDGINFENTLLYYSGEISGNCKDVKEIQGDVDKYPYLKDAMNKLSSCRGY